MAWEGRVEGFAPIPVKPTKGRSGIITYALFHGQEVANPMVYIEKKTILGRQLKIGQVVAPFKKSLGAQVKVGQIASVFSTSVV